MIESCLRYIYCRSLWLLDANNDKTIFNLKFNWQPIKEIACETLKPNMKWSFEQLRLY